MLKYLLAVAAGAGLEYFLDPDRGRRRRHIAVDRVTSLVRRAGTQVGRRTRYVYGKATGVTKWAAYNAAHSEERVLEGVALAQKVKSEVLGRLHIPKKQVTVAANGRVIELRGELEDEAKIRELEEKVRGVTGVFAVENFLRVAERPAEQH